MVRPQPQNRSAKFGVSDTPVDKTARLVRKTEELLGNAKPQDDDDEE
jgi:hypothetical protein